ncbi:hypothetical protein ACKWTF_015025 [Chironomus riparius]
MSKKISDFFKATPKVTKLPQIKTEAEVDLEINLDDVQGLKSSNNQASLNSKIQQFVPKVIKVEPTAHKESNQIQIIKFPAIKEERIEKLPENIKNEPEKEFSIVLAPKSKNLKTEPEKEFSIILAPKSKNLKTEPEKEFSIILPQKSKNIKNEPKKEFSIILAPKSKNLKTEPEKEFLIILAPKSNQSRPKPSIKLHQCRTCSSKFLTAHGLATHIRIHKFGRFDTYECDFDGKIFTKKGNLKNHMRSHQLEVKCKICGQEKKVLSMKDHMIAVHSDKRKYKCHLCPKNFKLPSVLKNHLRSHDKQFECKICGKKVRNGQDLKFHIKQFHENPRSFKCEICEKGFFDKGNFKKHLKTHDKNRDKAYKCDRCNYSSDNKAHYKQHQASHARWDEKVGKNALKCPKCSFMFKDKKHLSCHIAVVHPKVLFQCDLCAMYSKTKANLEKHIRVVHLKNSTSK